MTIGERESWNHQLDNHNHTLHNSIIQVCLWTFDLLFVCVHWSVRGASFQLRIHWHGALWDGALWDISRPQHRQGELSPWLFVLLPCGRRYRTPCRTTVKPPRTPPARDWTSAVNSSSYVPQCMYGSNPPTYLNYNAFIRYHWLHGSFNVQSESTVFTTSIIPFSVCNVLLLALLVFTLALYLLYHICTPFCYCCSFSNSSTVYIWTYFSTAYTVTSVAYSMSYIFAFFFFASAFSLLCTCTLWNEYKLVSNQIF